MSRLRGLARGELDPEQRALYDEIVESRRGGGSFELIDSDGALTGPFNAMVHNPGLGRHWSAIGARLRFQSALDQRLVELAICTVGAHFQSEFELYAHAPLARAAGVSAEAIAALCRGVPPAFDHSDERLVHALVTHLVRGERVSAALYEEAERTVGEQGLVELASLAGYYAALAIGLNLFEVGAPSGNGSAWPDTI